MGGYNARSKVVSYVWSSYGISGGLILTADGNPHDKQHLDSIFPVGSFYIDGVAQATVMRGIPAVGTRWRIRHIGLNFHGEATGKWIQSAAPISANYFYLTNQLQGTPAAGYGDGALLAKCNPASGNTTPDVNSTGTKATYYINGSGVLTPVSTAPASGGTIGNIFWDDDPTVQIGLEIVLDYQVVAAWAAVSNADADIEVEVETA